MPRSLDTPLPTGAAKATAVRAMFDSIAHRYDLLNRVLTFGLDVVWRKRTVRDLGLPSGSLVLDVACGTGDLCRELARQGHRPVGLDFSAGMLAAARTDAPLVQGDALHLPIRDGAVDGVTCGFALRNVVDLRLLFAELARIVRPGGRIGLLEVAEPESRVLRAGHRLWFGRVVPAVGGLISDRAAYRYLPQSVAYLPPPPELVRLVETAGFMAPERHLMPPGAAQLVTATRR